jgi:5-methylcytosine-specific restriction endonuclease McrA
MCRKTKNRCVLLGEDPARWSRYEPLPPIAAVVEAFVHFHGAATASVRGDLEAARAELSRVDSPAIREWYIDHVLVSGEYRVALLGRVRARPIPASDRDARRMPTGAMTAEILARDGFRCRYCQRPVVTRKVLRRLQSLVGPECLPLGPTDDQAHGAVLVHSGVVDHVFPHQLGGRTSLENLVTACYPCNFAKAHFTLEEMGMEGPRPPLKDGWDGLQASLLASSQ